MQRTKSQSPKTSASPEIEADSIKSFLGDLQFSLIVHILKTLSSKKNALSALKIARLLTDYTGKSYDQKTIRSNITPYIDILEKDKLWADRLTWLLGGKIISVCYGPKNDPYHKYYFEPLLDAGDVDMICGSIACNRYLTHQEKNYLISREEMLTLLKNDVKEIPVITKVEKIVDGKIVHRSNKSTYYEFPDKELPEKPHRKPDIKNPTVNLLHHVNQLHNAIKNGYSIKIHYGVYDRNTNNQVHFQVKNKDPYMLNPYALLWNGGFYYLLATFKGHDNPVHFRVDRIVDIKPIPSEDDARIPESRDNVPEILKPYFQQTSNGESVFLSEKYTAVYPLMGIYNDENRVSCSIECTDTTLSILIDTFGNKLVVKESPRKHTDRELDIHGNPQKFFAVDIKNVQYDNILQFCLQQHASITVLQPERLIEDVKKGLLASLDRYSI